jgi:hypothetical protein
VSEDEKPPEPPTGPRLVDTRPKKDRAITAEMYERLWELYRDMPARSMRKLTQVSGLSEKTCTKAINLGWPARSWPSLRERAVLWDKRARENADKPLTEKQILDLQRFMEIRNENLNVSRSFRALASRLALRINDAIDRATASRTYKAHRVIQVQVGKKTVDRAVQEDVELPPYLPHLASAARDLGSLVFAAGEAERNWAKIAPPEDVPEGETGWESLTDEQHRYIIEHEGKLPPGVTIEQLRGRP